MTARFERRAGSEETLLALYDVVGAAEEVDLVEQAHNEALRAEVGPLHEESSDERDEAGDVSGTPDTEDIDDAIHVTMSQAVGIVEHLLGGHPTS